VAASYALMYDAPMGYRQAVIGPFEFDIANRRLTRAGESIPLGSRAAAVLIALAEAQGRTLTKSELLARCWPGVEVEEGNLTVQISALRKLLGDPDGGADWIITVPRVGYRLAVSGSYKSVLATLPGAPVLAILPFACDGRREEDAALEHGIRAGIDAALARHRNLILAEPAREGPGHSLRDLAWQGIGYVIDGSFHRVGVNVRVNIRLLDTESGVILWSDHFDGTVDDYLSFEDRVAFAVSAYVDAAVQSAEYRCSLKARPDSLAAYDLYLRALHLFQTFAPEDHAAAYGLMARALDHEPENPVYLSFAADALCGSISYGWPSISSDDKERSVGLARSALKRAEGNPLVMAASGAVLIEVARDYDAGMAANHAAIEAGPDHDWRTVITGCALLHCGDLDVALKNFGAIVALGSKGQHYFCAAGGIAHAEMARGNYEAAHQWALRSHAACEAFAPALWMLIAANAHLGRLETARRYLVDLKRIVPRASLAGIANGQVHQYPERFMPILAGMKQAGLT
jgi:DNA-binding winged helix-turn-helix (wHTH) protein/TolB-like protein/Tfp pilus assembly protein PilF